MDTGRAGQTAPKGRAAHAPILNAAGAPVKQRGETGRVGSAADPDLRTEFCIPSKPRGARRLLGLDGRTAGRVGRGLERSFLGAFASVQNDRVRIRFDQAVDVFGQRRDREVLAAGRF